MVRFDENDQKNMKLKTKVEKTSYQTTKKTSFLVELTAFLLSLDFFHSFGDKFWAKQ